MLDHNLIEKINLVVDDKRVQACIVSALCDSRDDEDMWLALEDDVDAFPPQITRLLFGEQYFEDETAALKGLYDCGHPASEVMEEIVRRVEKRVRNVLLGHNDNYCVECNQIKPCDCPHTDE